MIVKPYMYQPFHVANQEFLSTFAGFISSWLVAPADRLKCTMWLVLTTSKPFAGYDVWSMNRQIPVNAPNILQTLKTLKSLSFLQNNKLMAHTECFLKIYKNGNAYSLLHTDGKVKLMCKLSDATNLCLLSERFYSS